jgi:ABC-type phosphate/phosphonate transport system ATPase subunit
MSEIMKVFAASNMNAFDVVFNATQFVEATGTVAAGTGAFFLATNFENDAAAGQALISGRDLNSSNVYLNLTQYASSVACVVDTFALYDVVMSYNMADGSVSMSK